MNRVSLGEEECRRYIIVFHQPCPCMLDGFDMAPEEALARELLAGLGWAQSWDSVDVKRREELLDQARHLLSLFIFQAGPNLKLDPPPDLPKQRNEDP